MEYQIFNGRKICVKGIGVLFYEKGLPLTISISELNKKDIEVSMMHVVEEFWENGWSWKTIESKLKGEIGIDIETIREIPEMEQIVERLFSDTEKKVFYALPENKKKTFFFPPFSTFFFYI